MIAIWIANSPPALLAGGASHRANFRGTGSSACIGAGVVTYLVPVVVILVALSHLQAKAHQVAEWFSDFGAFKSHSRRVGRDDAEAQGLKIVRLDDDKDLQEAVLSVHHAFKLTLSQTPTTKIIENHNGRAYIEMAQTIVVAQQQTAPNQGAPSAPPSLGNPGQPGLPQAP